MKPESADGFRQNLTAPFNLAGEGIPELPWSQIATGTEAPNDVVVERACRKDTGFIYRNDKIIMINDHMAGMTISYLLDDPYILGNLSA